MNSIVSAELFRLSKTKWYKTLLFVFAAICVLVAAVIFIVMAQLVNIYGEAMSSQVWTSYGPTVIQTLLSAMTPLGSVSNVFVLISVSVFVCKELNQRTVSNALVAGKSRAQVFFAYLFVGAIIGASFYVVFAVVCGVCTPIICSLAGIAASKAISAYSTCLLLGLLSTAFCVSVVVLFAFVTKSQGGSIMLPLVACVFLPSAISTVITIAELVAQVNGYVISAVTLSWIPIYNITLFNPFAADCWTEMLKIALYEVIFVGGFVGLGYLAAKNAELK